MSVYVRLFMERLTRKTECGDYGWKYNDDTDMFKSWNKLGKLEDKQEELLEMIKDVKKDNSGCSYSRNLVLELLESLVIK